MRVSIYICYSFRWSDIVNFTHNKRQLGIDTKLSDKPFFFLLVSCIQFYFALFVCLLQRVDIYSNYINSDGGTQSTWWRGIVDTPEQYLEFWCCWLLSAVRKSFHCDDIFSEDPVYSESFVADRIEIVCKKTETKVIFKSAEALELSSGLVRLIVYEGTEATVDKPWLGGRIRALCSLKLVALFIWRIVLIISSN